MTQKFLESFGTKRDKIEVSFPAKETKLLAEEYLRSWHLLTIHWTLPHLLHNTEKKWHSKELAKKCHNWIKRLAAQIKVPRCIGLFKKPINEIDLHASADASINGASADMYAIVHQNSGNNAELLCSKNRLSRKHLTMLQLELVPTDIASTMTGSARQALSKHHIARCFGLTCGTVALYWIREENGQWKQFFSNRFAKIQEKEYISWRYVTFLENCAEFGSWGCLLLNYL